MEKSFRLFIIPSERRQNVITVNVQAALLSNYGDGFVMSCTLQGPYVIVIQTREHGGHYEHGLRKNMISHLT